MNFVEDGATLTRQTLIPLLQAEQLAAAQADFSVISYSQAVERRCAIIHVGDRGGLLMVDPRDQACRIWAYQMTPECCGRLFETDGRTFEQWLAMHEDRLAALSMNPEVGHAASDEPEQMVGELSLASVGAESNEIVRFVDSTLLDALKAGASDVHLEGEPRGLIVKFRLDGVLAAVGRLDGERLAEQVISRIKVLSELDIAERRIPQDGRLTVAFRRRAIDVRVSVMPSVHGEDVVLRILDRQHLAQALEGLTLTKLGFDADTVARFKKICARPHGMVLVTGPTGSGKTTTMYAALTETRNPQEKVVTIEDPVEYELRGMLQIPVNERKGLTFARGLRSILRHDPDRILVGEIRDQETAQIAVQSALTGHLVYTTVHANGAFDVLGRFSQLGIDRHDLAAALNGVLAQRLIRIACPLCRSPSERRTTASARIQVSGCDHCRGTGYRGRRAIGELLVLSPELKAAFSGQAPRSDWIAQAARQGFVSLRERACELAERGETTFDEVDRVTLMD